MYILAVFILSIVNNINNDYCFIHVYNKTSIYFVTENNNLSK